MTPSIFKSSTMYLKNIYQWLNCDNSFEPIKSLNLDIIIQNFSLFVVSCPSNVFIFYTPLHTFYNTEG